MVSAMPSLREKRGHVNNRLKKLGSEKMSKTKRLFRDIRAISPTVGNARLSSTIAALCLTAVLILSMSGIMAVPAVPASEEGGGAKNVILLIGDGMGFAQVTAARIYHVGPDGDLNMDTLDYTGYVSTHSLNSLVTDSAAAGTALATGKKTNNRIISQSPTGKEYETILEVAKELGKATGIVTTARITHATPAVFGAHSSSRYNWDDIAKDYLYQVQPDLLLGGGLRYWLDDSEPGSHRTVEKLMEQGLSEEEAQADDGLIDDAQRQGYAVVYNQSELDALNMGSEDKVLGLFALSHMSYEIERPPEEPHIAHMTQKALEFLEKDPDGFFLMVEGARIDHAGHANNITLNVHDTIAFDEAVGVALDFAEEHPDTLVVVTADHECGGLSVEYPFESFPAEGEFIKDLDNESDYRYGIWTSGSHTAVDVPVMASGPCAKHLTGRLDNTKIFDVMKMAMTGRADTTTELTAEVIPAVSITVETTALDFGTVGAGLNSDTKQITVVNSGTHNVNVTAEIIADENNFYKEALRLNGEVVDDFSEIIPADITYFEYAENVAASLEVPEWAGGKYRGTVLFVAEGA